MYISSWNMQPCWFSRSHGAKTSFIHLCQEGSAWSYGLRWLRSGVNPSARFLEIPSTPQRELMVSPCLCHAKLACLSTHLTMISQYLDRALGVKEISEQKKNPEDSISWHTGYLPSISGKSKRDWDKEIPRLWDSISSEEYFPNYGLSVYSFEARYWFHFQLHPLKRQAIYMHTCYTYGYADP